MTLTIATILHLLAFVVFVAATLQAPSRVNLTAAGLALWMLSLVLATA